MAGADRARCYFVSGTRINGEEHSFDPARDMADLEAEAIRLGGIKLIVVDPVVSAVAGDGNKNNDVRRALQPLVDLASKLDAAVIGISHFSKAGQGGDPATRVVGSVAFTAVARVVLVAAKVKSEDGDTKRILARGKSNIGPDEGGFEYHIEQGEPIPGIVASFVTWGKAVEGSARELFAENERVTENAPDKTARENAEEFLIQLLKEGICPSRYVEAQAKEAGLSWATVKRASQSLGLKKRKVNESWYWERPNLLNQLAQDAQLAKSEQVEQVDEQVDPGSPYAEVSLDQNFSDEF
jgi:putative DNA primase/helicase